MEVFVVAGVDAGSQFTIEGDAVLVGRGQPQTGQTDVVRLEDRSISRHQAWIRRDASSFTISHIDTASNPTLVNGREIDSVRLHAGDRIEMGRVAIDVRMRDGTNLSGLTEIMEGVARQSRVKPTPSKPRRSASRPAPRCPQAGQKRKLKSGRWRSSSGS
jgi:pSer/pThr/pTyr-binding forkhead associated (FHA) protein